MPKGSKIPFLGLDAKGHKKTKNPKRTSQEFLLYLSAKKKFIEIGPPEVCV